MIPSHLLLAQRIRDEVVQLERSVIRVRRAINGGLAKGQN